MNRNSQPCTLWRSYSPAPLDKQLCKTAIFGLSFATQNMRFEGTPSAVENAVIRMRCAPSLSRKTAIFERQTRKCPFRKRERTKSYVTAFLPHRKFFRRGPRFLPHAKSLRILRGGPGSIPHEKSCGFYAGTPDSAVVKRRHSDEMCTITLS